MIYKHIAFLLPLLATSLNGEQIGVWKVPDPLVEAATQAPFGPSLGLICPLQLECGEGLNASISITQQLGVTKITVIAGASKDFAVVPSSSADSVKLTVECDGQDLELTVGTSASSWSEVASCSQVGLE
jgi:hypothetical protein